ncbi:MAG: MFS transporter [Candidatus Brocadiia bacterium]
MNLDKRQKWMLARFSAYGFLKNLRFFQPLILLYFTQAKGLSYTEFGFLIGIREVGIYLMEIPTGIIADVTGRRRAMMMCFGAYLLAFFIFTVGAGFWVFVPGMVLFAAGEALRSGTHKSMIMTHLDLEGMSDVKVHYYGFTRSMSRLGSALSALMVGVFAFLGGDYSMIFPATMVPYVLALVLMGTYPAELDGKSEYDAVFRKMWEHTVESVRSLFRVPELGRMVLNESVFDAFFRVGKDYLQPIIEAAALGLPVFLSAGDQRRTFLLVGAVYFFVYLNSFLSSRLSGWFVDRVQNFRTALNWLFWAMSGVFIIAGFLFGEQMPVAAIIVLFALYTLYNVRKPAVIGFVSDRIPGQQRATVLSMHSQLRALSAAVIAPLLGLVADHPRFGVPWALLLGGLALLPLGLILRMKSDVADEER